MIGPFPEDDDYGDARDGFAQHAQCHACGRTFDILQGEVRFAAATGRPAPELCRWCRPTRRAALALQERSS